MTGSELREFDAASGDRLSLRLFGEFEVRGADGEAIALHGRRERILLAYLALHPDRMRNRRALIDFLWGDDADPSMLDNLRTCLWALRKALGDDNHDIVRADRDWIGVNPDALDVDVWRFCDLAGGSTATELEQAVELYDGDLLEGIDIASQQYGDWLREEQAHYRDIAIGALIRLMRCREEAGDDNGAIEAGQCLLKLDPYHEEAFRHILHLYAATGRRHMAPQLYKEFAERLNADLGIEPEAATRQALEDVLNGEAGPKLALAEARTEMTGDAAEDESSAETVAEPATAPAVRRIRPHWMRIAFWTSAVVLGACLGTLITVGILFWRVPELAPAPLGDMILGVKHQVEGRPPSLAVLSFRGRGDANATDLADALSAGIRSALSLTSDMFVVSGSSVEVYKRTPTAPATIASDLDVRYLLEGDVSKFGDAVHIRVGLIDTKEGDRYLSILNYERKTADLFHVQQEITLKVVTALQIQLTEGEQERIALVHGTSNFDAWLSASQGQKWLRQMTPEAIAQARDSYNHALARDANYAGAWIGLSWTYLLEARFGWASDRKARLLRAKQYAERAMALDPKRAAAYSLMGTIALLGGDAESARKLGERSVELNYNDADGAALLAYTLSYTGEPRRAIGLVRRAIRLRPYPPDWYRWLLARCQRLAGRPKEAIRILTSPPADYDSVVPLVELAAAYSEAGMHSKAQATAKTVLAAQPAFSARKWLTMPKYSDRNVAESEVKWLLAAGLPE